MLRFQPSANRGNLVAKQKPLDLVALTASIVERIILDEVETFSTHAREGSLSPAKVKVTRGLYAQWLRILLEIKLHSLQRIEELCLWSLPVLLLLIWTTVTVLLL